MNNGDMPAMPFEGGQNNGMQPYDGLTKREEFASRNMAAIISSNIYEPPRRKKFQGMAEDALAAADSLLAELEKDGKS